jgi:DNA-binding IclR family transcriptional regulator
MAKQDGGTIQSVERALSLLNRIAERPEAANSLGELAEYLGIDKSSVFRLLATLSNFGLVRQEDGVRGYRLGYGIFSLAGALRDQLKITELASPYLKRLALETRENAHLAVRSGARAVFIDRERAAATIAANTNIGDSEDLHCTAVGKCLACAMGREELEALLGGTPLERRTERTIGGIDALLAELELVRERGYALDVEENEANVVCVAAPIYDFRREVEAAIGISGPRERVGPRLGEFGTAVRAAALELSALLGWPRP